METKKGKCEDCFYSTKMDFDDEGLSLIHI